MNQAPIVKCILTWSYEEYSHQLWPRGMDLHLIRASIVVIIFEVSQHQINIDLSNMNNIKIHDCILHRIPYIYERLERGLQSGDPGKEYRQQRWNAPSYVDDNSFSGSHKQGKEANAGHPQKVSLGSTMTPHLLVLQIIEVTKFQGSIGFSTKLDAMCEDFTIEAFTSTAGTGATTFEGKAMFGGFSNDLLGVLGWNFAESSE
ncbi:hypothetical protein EV426DRAFT_575508 [Tirmania nivea]|nr:hypothetical protein EV426DRAFT_575508 [Tirmania nivea]